MKKHKTTIMQMFYHQRGNVDSIKLGAEDKELAKSESEKFQALKEKLQPLADIWDLFKKYMDAVALAQVEEVNRTYAEGFKFGLLIGIEAGESKFEE